uniref:RRM domain-containing protein n=1 Tax=Acrobeloides nanus TaxID=290746 RepID=A0A914D3Y3_9BILA
MSENRVFIGRLPHRATERDIEHLFRNFKVRDVVLKAGFGFVELHDSRDADDACYELNGKELLGERIVVEMSKGRRQDRGGYGGGGGYGGRGGYDRGYGGGGGFGGRGGDRYGSRPRSSRFPAPHSTRYRLVVENLSSQANWQVG